MADRGSIHTPFQWWGQTWSTARLRSLSELVREGAAEIETVALATLLIERGLSLTVAAQSSGAGKSTLLAALSAAISPDRSVVFPRGRFEHFKDIDQIDPGTLTLVVNEISPHLPGYCWDTALRGVLGRRSRGAQILATTHGRDCNDIVETLSGRPLHIPAHEIAVLDLMLFIDGQNGSNEDLDAPRLVGLTPGDRPSELNQFALVSRSGAVAWKAVAEFTAAHSLDASQLQDNHAARKEAIQAGNSPWDEAPSRFLTTLGSF